MFVVVPNVECDQVQGAVVGVGFVTLLEHVMLGDEMSGHGVEPHRQEGTDD